MKVTHRAEVDVGGGTVGEILRALLELNIPDHAYAYSLYEKFDHYVGNPLDPSTVTYHTHIAFEWIEEE